MCVLVSLCCLTAWSFRLFTTRTLQFHVGLFGLELPASLHFDKHARTHCVHTQSEGIYRPASTKPQRERVKNGEWDKVEGGRQW